MSVSTAQHETLKYKKRSTLNKFVAPDQIFSNPSSTGKKARPRRPRATQRERQRMQLLNQAFESLRRVVPRTHLADYQRLSKIATLRLAIQYIRAMGQLLTEATGPVSSEESHHGGGGGGDSLNVVSSLGVQISSNLLTSHELKACDVPHFVFSSLLDMVPHQEYVPPSTLHQEVLPPTPQQICSSSQWYTPTTSMSDPEMNYFTTKVNLAPEGVGLDHLRDNINCGSALKVDSKVDNFFLTPTSVPQMHQLFSSLTSAAFQW